MSNLKKALNFYVIVESDGVNKTAEINFASDPIGYAQPGAANFISSLFSALPADIPIDSLAASGLGGVVAASSSYDAVTHILSVTFTNAGADDTLYVLSGNALY